MDAQETVSDPECLHASWAELQKAQALVAQFYERWDVLEAKKNGSE